MKEKNFFNDKLKTKKIKKIIQISFNKKTLKKENEIYNIPKIKIIFDIKL